MITIKDVEKRTMTEAKRKEAKNSFFAFYIGRPISYLVTIPLLYTSISPNVITLISIVFSIGGFCLVSFGNSLLLRIIGFVCFFVWNILDGVDGNIARYKGLKSSNGDLLDTLGGYLSMVLILLSMGNLTLFDPNSHVYLNSYLPSILSGLSVVEVLVPRLLMHRKNSQRSEKVEENKEDKLNDKSNYGFVRIVALNFCDPAGFQEVIMLVCIIFSLGTEFCIFYFFLNLIIMIYSVVKLLDKKKR